MPPNNLIPRVRHLLQLTSLTTCRSTRTSKTTSHNINWNIHNHTTSRGLTTLPGHPHLYIHPHPTTPSTSLLTLLPTTPPTPPLSLGHFPTTPTTPLPTLQTFTPNPHFLPHLHTTLSIHSPSDPHTISLAQTFAATSSSSLLHPPQRHRRDGGLNRGPPPGGWIHISDLRNPPEWSRIPDPEDIFGSVEVSAQGEIREGSYQPCIGYRVWTRSGVMQLPPYLREKLVEHLLLEEERIRTEAEKNSVL
ncbi:hypothetical protein DFH27DRAFT_597451 [Peziza echinospora]|nr:hypothetical protein DFH27DRAFT_597451 [Peziza echinospora]